jgi:hypothetical protein
MVYLLVDVFKEVGNYQKTPQLKYKGNEEEILYVI